MPLFSRPWQDFIALCVGDDAHIVLFYCYIRVDVGINPYEITLLFCQNIYIRSLAYTLLITSYLLLLTSKGVGYSAHDVPQSFCLNFWDVEGAIPYDMSLKFCL